MLSYEVLSGDAHPSTMQPPPTTLPQGIVGTSSAASRISSPLWTELRRSSIATPRSSMAAAAAAYSGTSVDGWTFLVRVCCGIRGGEWLITLGLRMFYLFRGWILVDSHGKSTCDWIDDAWVDVRSTIDRHVCWDVDRTWWGGYDSLILSSTQCPQLMVECQLWNSDAGWWKDDSSFQHHN